MDANNEKHRIGVTLLSGGADSTTCLYAMHAANPSYNEHHALSINYGQRHSKEIEYAKKSCNHLGIYHHTRDMQNLPKSMLTDPSVKVPDISYSEIEGVSPTYVPFRNGMMLSLLTAFTEGLIKQNEVEFCNEAGNDINEGEMPEISADIYFGAHSEDAANWAYPDCTPEFIGAMANAIFIGSYQRIRLITPLQWLNKRQVMELGHRLGVKWENTWSCYKGEERHCGTCPTCRSRKEAFINAHIPDPTEYAA